MLKMFTNLSCCHRSNLYTPRLLFFGWRNKIYSSFHAANTEFLEIKASCLVDPLLNLDSGHMVKLQLSFSSKTSESGVLSLQSNVNLLLVVAESGERKDHSFSPRVTRSIL
mmetsp:Transcript_45085/g.72043  ORF Transcript_45085/g.72043 Transcript_45085/m.72043 type:complete len:111 (+) Transcript_45085:52-384(+)